MALVDGQTVTSRGGMEEELDTLLRVVADEDNAGKKGLPEQPPPGWLPADRESRCCWVPVERRLWVTGLSTQTCLPNWCPSRFYYYFVTALSQLVMHDLPPALCAGSMCHLGTCLLSEERGNAESEVEAGVALDLALLYLEDHRT
eukprot:s1550_g3.t1